MAIYYIDPHTTTNGTGTWASPWSLNTAHNTLVSGDEVRIKGVALTSLLTGTSYTATVTNKYQLTITAGGGLGADWAVGDTAYITEFDTFFKVTAKATNVISCGSSNNGMLPISNTSTTPVTLRKVDTTSYPVSTTSTTYNTTGSYSSSLNNITISDCWTDATTRVTDGTVKTLFNTSSTSSTYFYFDGRSSSYTYDNWTLNLQNTHIMAGADNFSGVYHYTYASNSTFNINQIHQYYFAGGLYIGSTTAPAPQNCTINITNYVNGSISAANGNNFTLDIKNYITVSNQFFSGSYGAKYLSNSTVNIETIVCGSAPSGIFNVLYCSGLNFNLTVAFDCWLTTSPSNMSVVYGVGPGNFVISSSAILKYNKRASNITTITYGVRYSFVQSDSIIPDYSLPSGISVTTKYLPVGITEGSVSQSTKIPSQSKLIFKTFPVTAQLPYGNTFGCNVLVTANDSQSPVEILSLQNTGLSLTAAATSFPVVSTDSVVYRTAAPSIKSNLNTKTSTYWTGVTRATKTIKIPCTASTSYTITGYIRTDDTSYVNGDCRIGIYLNNSEVTGQNMTTSCINAWEQFTLTFTASTTGEYVLAWSMYYANGAKSYWLDDLTIA